jgi:hypothetical protein
MTTESAGRPQWDAETPILISLAMDLSSTNLVANMATGARGEASQSALSGRSHNKLFYLKGPNMFFQTAILRYPKVFSKPIYHNVYLVNPSVCFFNSNVC